MNAIEIPNLSEFEGINFRTKGPITVIAAVHSTKLGPAVGGCRLMNYNNFQEQFVDTLRLAEGMTYKNSFAGIPHGGGKMTVNVPKGIDVSDERIVSLICEILESFGGDYYTAKDVGFTSELLNVLRERTRYVLGHYSGDPSSTTALGIYYGILACLEHRKIESGQNIKIGIEGLGGVGSNLVRYLFDHSSKLFCENKFDLYFYDTNYAAYDSISFAAGKTSNGNIKTKELDIYSPNALGACIDENFGDIKASIIAGAANNQMLNKEISQKVFESGKLYAPDFVINAGGVINTSQEFLSKNKDVIRKNAKEACINIKDSLKEIFEESEKRQMPTDQVAILLAKEKLN